MTLCIFQFSVSFLLINLILINYIFIILMTLSVNETKR